MQARLKNTLPVFLYVAACTIVCYNGNNDKNQDAIVQKLGLGRMMADVEGIRS